MRDWFVVLGLAGLFMIWWHWRRLKDLALQLASRRCDEQGLQLLDETVQLESCKLARNARHERVLERRYRFEFTCTGGERYWGRITLRGDRLEVFELPPHLLVSREDSSDAERWLH